MDVRQALLSIIAWVAFSSSIGCAAHGAQKAIWEVKLDDPRFRRLCVSPDSKMIAVATGPWSGMLQKPTPGKCYVIDSSDGKIVSELPHDDGVSGVEWVGPHSIITSSYDGALRKWDVNKGTPVWEGKPLRGPIFAMALAPDQSRVGIAGVGDQGVTFAVVDMKDMEVKQQVRAKLPEMVLPTAVCFAPNGTRLMYGDTSGQVGLVDIATGEQASLLQPEELRGVRRMVINDQILAINWRRTKGGFPHGITEGFSLTDQPALVSKWRTEGGQADDNPATPEVTIVRGSKLIVLGGGELRELTDLTSVLGKGAKVVGAARSGSSVFVATDDDASGGRVLRLKVDGQK